MILLAVITGYVYFINNQIMQLNFNLQEDIEAYTKRYITNINKLNKEYAILTISSLHTIHYLLSLLMEQDSKTDYFELYSKFFNDIVERETRKYEEG